MKDRSRGASRMWPGSRIYATHCLIYSFNPFISFTGSGFRTLQERSGKGSNQILLYTMTSFDERISSLRLRQRTFVS